MGVNGFFSFEGILGWIVEVLLATTDAVEAVFSAKLGCFIKLDIFFSAKLGCLVGLGANEGRAASVGLDGGLSALREVEIGIDELLEVEIIVDEIDGFGAIAGFAA